MIPFHFYVLALLATTQARSIYLQDLRFQPYQIDAANLAQDGFQDVQTEPLESVHPAYFNRIRRSLTSMTTHTDGSSNYNIKVPIVTGESNMLSAVGSASGILSADKPGYSALGGGLALDNINGYGVSLTGQHIPGLGNQATAAGRVTLVDTDDHKLGANAFVSRTMSSINDLPSFNTYGGSVDYTYKDRIGGSLGVSHTDGLFKKTDYSAMANLNLYRNPTTSLDLSAGLTKSQSPFSTFDHDWQPQAGLSFTKYF